MQKLGWSLVVVFAIATLAQAQTINGESSYEDNFHHVPPADPASQQQGVQARPGAGERGQPSPPQGSDRKD